MTDLSGAGSRRVAAIDGLRGVAALMVLGQHLSLTKQWFAQRINAPTFTPIGFFPHHPWVNLVTFVEWSPLHILFANNAYFIFFVISGFILVNSAQKLTARAYGIGRLTRLYLPSLVAVVPALVFFAFYKSSSLRPSAWLDAHDVSWQWTHVVGLVTLVDGVSNLNSSLWTMRYELLFSVMLPVVLWRVGSLTHRSRVVVAALVGLAALSAVGFVTNLDLVLYLPVFFAGSLLNELAAPARRSGWWITAGILLLTAVWTLGGFHVRTGRFLADFSTVLGAIAVVHGVRTPGWAERALSSRLGQFLGRRSYSLFLLQVPVITFVWLVVRVPADRFGELEHLGLALGMLAVMVELFYRHVEVRALRYSRALSRRINASHPSLGAGELAE